MKFWIKKHNYFEKRGYTEIETIKTVKTIPAILSYDTNNIDIKFQYLKSKEYKAEEIIKMTNSLPSIFCSSIEILKEQNQIIISLNYCKYLQFIL